MAKGTVSCSEGTASYVVVGLGGIGAFVLRGLVPFLHTLKTPCTVLAIDGDRFEESNRVLQ